jgi:hypothetical protein
MILSVEFVYLLISINLFFQSCSSLDYNYFLMNLLFLIINSGPTLRLLCLKPHLLESKVLEFMLFRTLIMLLACYFLVFVASNLQFWCCC